MDAKTLQKVAFARRDNGCVKPEDNYKRWMLKFYHEDFGNEIFYFETKEAMLKFASQDGIKIEKMFYLADVEQMKE